MLKAIGDFLWFVFLVFLAMIVGWWIIQFLDSRFGGNLVGKGARAFGAAADPQG